MVLATQNCTVMLTATCILLVMAQASNITNAANRNFTCLGHDWTFLIKCHILLKCGHRDAHKFMQLRRESVRRGTLFLLEKDFYHSRQF